MFLTFNEVQPRLKDIHEKYQTDIINDLTKISTETVKILKNLTEIEAEINTYQSEIDGWSKKLDVMTTEC